MITVLMAVAAAIHVGNASVVNVKDGEHLVSQVRKQKNLEKLNTTL